jgi:hypothetical protein
LYAGKTGREPVEGQSPKNGNARGKQTDFSYFCKLVLVENSLNEGQIPEIRETWEEITM